MSDFVDKLNENKPKTNITALNLFGGDIIKYGFCEIEEPLVDGIEVISLRWGGTYKYKIDGMHFEIPNMIKK